MIAGSWLIASVCIERTMQRSSAIAGRVRQQLAEPRAALAVPGELEDRRRDREALLARGHRREPLAHADRVGQLAAAPLRRVAGL